MKRMCVMVLTSILFSGCSEVVDFGLASINLFFTLLKISGIIIVVALVIGLIASMFKK